jgi:2-polyprenyl-3-methyl-5-hydroxy-6-metoxy-1,4-benzoquinol methylase
MMKNKEPFNIGKYRINFLKYTRKAFRMLPDLDEYIILDVGCGTGIPSMALAKLSGGNVTALDRDDEALQKFKERVRNSGLEKQIEIINRSFLKHDINGQQYNLIWAEGSINHIGYDQSFQKCHEILGAGGFIVIHDLISQIRANIEKILEIGFKLYNSFELPKNAWWIEFYKPISRKIEKRKKRALRKSKLLQDPTIARYEREIAMVQKNPGKFDTGFFIFQKITTGNSCVQREQ